VATGRTSPVPADNCLAAEESGIIQGTNLKTLAEAEETMLERYKYAGAVLTMTLTLGLHTQGLRAAADEAKAPEPEPATEEAAPEAKASDTQPSNEMKTLDAVAVRPVTFVTSVFSAGAFVLALPFAALDPAIDVEKTRKTLVSEPFQDTFQRPLGDFNGSAWGD